MMQRVLIANRGEIAIRLARAARACGIVPVGIASEIDRFALHRHAMAESLVLQGVAPYLNIAAIVEAALALHADAIHPGYGFLSERAEFAQAVEDAGLCFIGPSPQTLQAAGDKRTARILARNAGIPIIEGYDEAAQEPEHLLAQARRIGFPLLIKASQGGGGRGQRVVRGSETFFEALASAQREALAAFGDASVLLERYIEHPRHIEWQIAVDHAGTIAVIGERDCSLQRRRQKIIEEAPAQHLPAQIRTAMIEAARTIAQATSYRNLGTVEFLLDHEQHFFFLEVNARLQVEHPVTEAVTGIDLAVLQYHIAQGHTLPSEIIGKTSRGWAFEARICAEDPAQQLLPSSGIITKWQMPQGAHIRVDSGFGLGSEVPLDYDSLLAKLIVHGPDRASALAHLHDALAQTTIEGLSTNLAVLRTLTEDERVIQGTVTTEYLDTSAILERWVATEPALTSRHVVLALAAALLDDKDWRVADLEVPLYVTIADQVIAYHAGREAERWHLTRADAIVHALRGKQPSIDANVYPEHLQLALRIPESTTVLHDSSIPMPFEVDIIDEIGALSATLLAMRSYDKNSILVESASLHEPLRIDRRQALGVDHLPKNATDEQRAGEYLVTSPMPGRVTRLLVKVGDTVADRQLVAIIEAMKMEHHIVATSHGKVAQVFINEGQSIAAKAPIVHITPTQGADTHG